MKILFKILTDTPTDELTVSDTNFKDHFPYIQENTSWKNLYRQIRTVTRDYIIPYVTREFYDDLVTKYHAAENVSELTPEEQEVLEYLQDSIAEYTIWKRSSGMKLSQGDMGAMAVKGKDGMAVPASAWEYAHYYWTVVNDADNHLDTVLDLLDNGNLPTFNANKSKLRLANSFIRTTKAFEQYEYINGSRRTFKALMPSIIVAHQPILELLGKEAYNEILTFAQKPTFTPEEQAAVSYIPNQKLVIYIQKYIAHTALNIAIPRLSVMVEQNAITVVTTMDGMATKTTAQSDRVAALLEATEKDSKLQLEAIKKLLYGKPDDYPTWKAAHATEFETPNTDTYPLSFGDGAVFLS